jgi:protein-tyrosine phosphatase
MGCDLDVTRILPRLYQGSAPPPGEDVRRCGFDLLVLSAIELVPEQPAHLFPGVQVIHAPMDDAVLSDMERSRAARAAYQAATAIGYGGRVLITCAMGRNRSGLIMAFTMHLLTGKSGRLIIQHIQSRRKRALTNGSFVLEIDKLKERK